MRQLSGKPPKEMLDSRLMSAQLSPFSGGLHLCLQSYRRAHNHFFLFNEEVVDARLIRWRNRGQRKRKEEWKEEIWKMRKKRLERRQETRWSHQTLILESHACWWLLSSFLSLSSFFLLSSIFLLTLFLVPSFVFLSFFARAEGFQRSCRTLIMKVETPVSPTFNFAASKLIKVGGLTGVFLFMM